MIPVTASWPFQKWAIDITGPFLEAPGRVKFLIVAIDYFTKWIEAKPVASINVASFKKFIWEFIICRFGLPMNLGMAKSNAPTEQSLAESRKETPFSLTYGTEAMIPAEVGVPSPRITLPKDNNAERRLDLMLLEERRELAAIREQNYKRQLQKYYNTKVKICKFNAGDYVLCNNEASRAHAQGKLAPSWEGPYQIKEVLGKGAYTLMHLDGSAIPRTWNATQLRRCYM
ncbi:uncharacterized protein LOC143624448 [Bidens hawaiensis]|uniref:uncharacterized protein LOC143624448 n=1 Tax=Bidens hawaiensis TaxID=980011 RepID=UPI00404A585A